jgi:hypothetical protein
MPAAKNAKKAGILIFECGNVEAWSRYPMLRTALLIGSLHMDQTTTSTYLLGVLRHHCRLTADPDDVRRVLVSMNIYQPTAQHAIQELIGRRVGRRAHEDPWPGHGIGRGDGPGCSSRGRRCRGHDGVEIPQEVLVDTLVVPLVLREMPRVDHCLQARLAATHVLPFDRVSCHLGIQSPLDNIN